ncbi:MAG: type II 3-dehydroquinate dehydratase [Actinomycetes bacterium]
MTDARDPDAGTDRPTGGDLTVLLLHGPNLSQLGTRDPAHYGTATLDDVVAAARAEATSLGARLDAEQHESESALVRRVHAARGDGTGAVVVNAGALTHTSVALRDALELLDVPAVEVHLSNVHARERFRHTSLLAGVCVGSVVGFGVDGYPLAVRAAVTVARRPR